MSQFFYSKLRKTPCILCKNRILVLRSVMPNRVCHSVGSYLWVNDLVLVLIEIQWDTEICWWTERVHNTLRKSVADLALWCLCGRLTMHGNKAWGSKKHFHWVYRELTTPRPFRFFPLCIYIKKMAFQKHWNGQGTLSYSFSCVAVLSNI